MRLIRLRIVLVAAAVWLGPASVIPASAQESIFSLQFLGISEETGSVRARGTGVLGIAQADPQSAITLNPAAHAALSRMTLSVMGVAGQRLSEDQFGSDRRGMARFPHARFALPVPYDLVLSVGFVGARNFRSDFVLPPNTVSGVAYSQRFDRSGTLYTMPVGIARGFFGGRLSLGASLDLLFGTVDESWTTGGDSILALRTRRRDTYTGQTVTLGTQIRPWAPVRIGFTFTPGLNRDRSSRTTIDDARVSGDGVPHRDESELTRVDFPHAWRAGLAYDFHRSWSVSADASRRDWGRYDGRMYAAEVLGVESRVGGGFEYRPRRAAVGWGRLAYRAGVSRTTWPQRVGGEAVRETAVHAGTGFDLTSGYGRLDLGLEYGRTGSIERNGREESSWRILLGFTGQENWRRRSPRNTPKQN